jgi:hypothetical protein
MGLFNDLESSNLPLMILPSRTHEELIDVLLNLVLESALKLGFMSAQIDSCHMLFAAWNELGKRDYGTS